MLALAVGLGVLASLHGRAASVSPVPGEQTIEDTPTADGSGFPDVDWEAWRAINPDVIGWISIPGTPVDYPIVQAPADDPTYYLKHDVYLQAELHGLSLPRCGLRRGRSFRQCELRGSSAITSVSETPPCSTPLRPTRMPLSRGNTAVCYCRHRMRGESSRCRPPTASAGGRLRKRTRFESEADFSQWYADRLVGERHAPH